MHESEAESEADSSLDPGPPHDRAPTTGLESLSPEQRAVVDSWGQGIAVVAGAGAGKTTTLVIKCEELIRRSPSARFAAVSFTERSASDLRKKLSARLNLEGAGAGSHWIMTIHGFCAAIIGEAPALAGFTGEERMLNEAESELLWRRACEGIFFEDLPEQVGRALDLLLERESRASLAELLGRVRALSSFGAIDFLDRTEDEASRALSRLTRHVLSRYEKAKARRGAMDFDDLERGADRALESPELRERLQKRFQLILIDEFQDTNPVQARIVERICLPGLSNLCVVGDPKQSIYRFRDADVSLFDEFCSRMPKKFSLTWNFRSRPGIIEAVNQICEKAFHASEMEYHALEAKRPALSPEESGSACSTLRLDVRTPADLATFIRSEQERGVPLHEMAVLMRRIRGNEKWLKALSAAGIPVAIGGGGLFWEDPRVRELVSFLKWWDDPRNELSGAVFLRSPWVGVPDTEIDEWIRKDRAANVPTFTSFFASSLPTARSLAPLRGTLVRPGEVLLALLKEPSGGAILEREIGSSLLSLWHKVEDLSSRGLDFHAVTQELSRALDEGKREREIPPPKNQGQLSVLTLHSSKGLEFEHVFLIDFGGKTRARPAPLLFWDRHRGAFLAPRDEEGERDPKHPLESDWRKIEKSKELAESKRLFYVALTRARERLILVCPEADPAQEETPPKDPESSYYEDDWKGWLEASRFEIPRVQTSKSLAPSNASSESLGSSADDRPAPPREALDTPKSVEVFRPRHSVTEWNLLSRCPRAYEWRTLRPPKDLKPAGLAATPDNEAVAGPGAGANQHIDSKPCLSQHSLSQMEIGTRAHRCLELQDFEGLHALEAEAGSQRFRAEPLISWAQSSPWMLPSDPATGREVWSELPFELRIGSETLVGAIDRLVKTPDGAFTVVDFKITTAPRSKDQWQEDYGTQLGLYSEAVDLLTALSRTESDPLRTIETLLISISPQGVEEVRIPTRSNGSVLASEAARLVQGEPGAPRPGKLCHYCEFREICDALTGP